MLSLLTLAKDYLYTHLTMESYLKQDLILEEKGNGKI